MMKYLLFTAIMLITSTVYAASCSEEPDPEPGCKWVRVWRGTHCEWECVPIDEPRNH